MLVVTVELWPGGRASESKAIARAAIGNMSALADKSDYSVSTWQDAAKHLGVEEEWMTFDIKRHNRKQSVWALIEKVARIAKLGTPSRT